MQRPGRVVLFFPSYYSDEAAPPLALIHLAAPLVEAGFAVDIVDSAVSDDPVREMVERADGAVCVGISMVTGPMITQGVEVARAVRASHPRTPIVAGGWHPSILPEQTLEAPYLDAVVKGQGEITLLEIVRRYAEGERDLADIAGAFFKSGAELRGNPPRGYTDINSLPRRPFELVDFERYARKCKGFRWLLYCSSHGCPWDCSYCSNASVYGRNWKPLSAERTVDEMSGLARRYGLHAVDVIDDNYLVRRDRALEIAERLIRERLEARYYIQTRTDQVDRLSDGELELLAKSGLSRIFFGIESGSARVLKSVNKRLELDTAYRTAERCRRFSIHPSFNLIFGLPAEEPEDLRETIVMIDEMRRRNPEAAFFTNIFSPYPGSPIFPAALRAGLREPKTLEEWAAFYPRTQQLPWLSPEKHARIQRIREYIRLGYSARRMAVHRATGLKDAARSLLERIARWRLRRLSVGFPVEVWLVNAWRRLKSWTGSAEPAVIN